jgi:actin-like ATPase involved in cell morphogenesis
MQLVNMKTQAETMANEKIKELVLTVPPYWTEQERKAIINAAEIAGMRISTLVSDGLASTNPPGSQINSESQLTTERQGRSPKIHSTI